MKKMMVLTAWLGLAGFGPALAAIDDNYTADMARVAAKYGSAAAVPAASVSFLATRYGKSAATIRADLAAASAPAPVEPASAPAAEPAAVASAESDEEEAAEEPAAAPEAEEAAPSQDELFDALLGATAKGKGKKAAKPTAGEDHDNQVEVGMRTVAEGGESWVYNEYRDTQSGLFAPSMDFARRDDRHTMKATGTNLGRNDMSFGFESKVRDRRKFTFNWNEIPHNFAINAPTPWTGIGGEVLHVIDEDGNVGNGTLRNTLHNLSGGGNANPSAAQGLAQFNLLSAILNAGTAPTTDLGFVRERGNLGFETRAGEGTYSFRIDRDHRKGTRPLMQGFGFSWPSELPQPIDYTTTDLTMGFKRDMKNVSLELSVFNSDFANPNSYLQWDNPFRTTDGPGGAGNSTAGDIGIASLPADNEFRQWSFNAMIKNLWRGGRVNVSYATGHMEQSEPVLNLISTNTAIAGLSAAQQQANLDQAIGPDRRVHNKIKVTTTNVGYRVRPTDKTSFKANYKIYDYENESPEIYFAGGLHIGDGYTSVNPAANSDALGYWGRAITERPSYKNIQLDLAAGYDLSDRHLVSLEYAKKKMERHHREVDETDEDVYALTFSGRPTDKWSYRFGYEIGDRKAPNYDYLVPFFGVTINPNVAPQANNENPQLPWLRKYDEAGRERSELGLQLTFSPRSDLSFGAIYKDWTDDYDAEVLFGLTKDERQLYGFDFDFRATRKLGFTGFWNREESEGTQWARQWNPGAPGVNDPYPPGQDLAPFPSNGNWSGTNTEDTDTFGFGLNWDFKPERWNANLGFTSAKNDGRWDFFSPLGVAANDANPYLPLPMEANDDSTYRTYRIGLRRSLKKDRSVAFGWVREELDYEDWNIGSDSNRPGVPLVIPSISTANGSFTGVGAVVMDSLPRDFGVDNFYVSYQIKF